MNALGFDTSSSDYLGAPTQQWLDQQAAQHETMMRERRNILLGISKFQTSGWPALPEGPYPPASDDSNFPRTGDPSLIVTKSGISAAALAEPGRITAGLLASAKARRPQLTSLFWIGLCTLGVGIYLLRKE